MVLDQLALFLQMYSMKRFAFDLPLMALDLSRGGSKFGDFQCLRTGLDMRALRMLEVLVIDLLGWYLPV